jgi:hypothetical protein
MDQIPRQHPVEISVFNPCDRMRQVRIARPGHTPLWVQCQSQAELESAINTHRPGIDHTDPEQVHWIDHPGEWSGI